MKILIKILIYLGSTMLSAIGVVLVRYATGVDLMKIPIAAMISVAVALILANILSKRYDIYRTRKYKDKEIKPRKKLSKKLIITIVVCSIAFPLIIVSVTTFTIYKNNYEIYANYYLTEQSNNWESKQFKVHIDVVRTKYYHLGTDIEIEHVLNQQLIADGDITTVEGRFLDFSTTITKKDSMEGAGYDSVRMNIPFYIDMDYRETKTVTIMVEKDGGKNHLDAYAVYEVTYTIEPYIPKEAFSFWDVVFMGDECRNPEKKHDID